MNIDKNLEMANQLRYIEAQTAKLMKLAESNSQLLLNREQLNKNKLVYMTDFAHEIKSPLTIVQHALEICEGVVKGEDKECVKHARSALRRVNSLIKNIMDWAKFSMDGNVFVKDPLNISTLIRKVIREISEADFHRHRIKINATRDAFVLGDGRYIGMAIKNIIENACKYSKADTEILVNVTRDSEQVMISVLDHGRGMAEEEKCMVFERFYRGARIRDNVAGGTGLGLAMSKDIVERHQGEIKIESVLGEGSEFTISFPRLKA